MIRHVVLFRLQDSATDRQAEAVVAALATLPDLVPEIRAFAVGRDLGLAEGNLSIAVTVDLDDAEAWRRYQAHPEHQRVVAEHVRPLLAARAAVQFAV